MGCNSPIIEGNKNSATRTLKYNNNEIGFFSCDLMNMDLSLYKLNFTVNSKITGSNKKFAQIFTSSFTNSVGSATDSRNVTVLIPGSAGLIYAKVPSTVEAFNITDVVANAICLGGTATATWNIAANCELLHGSVASGLYGKTLYSACSDDNRLFLANVITTPGYTTHRLADVPTGKKMQVTIAPGFVEHVRHFNLDKKVIGAECQTGRWIVFAPSDDVAAPTHEDPDTAFVFE